MARKRKTLKAARNKPKARPKKKPGIVAGTNLTYTDDEIITSLNAHSTVRGAAIALGMANTLTIYKRAKTNPAVKRAIQEGRRELISIAEDGLKTLLLVSDYKAIAFTLSTLGRQRYATRTETRIGGDKNAPAINSNQTYSIEELKELPLETRLQLLSAIREKQKREGTHHGSSDSEENTRLPAPESIEE